MSYIIKKIQCEDQFPYVKEPHSEGFSYTSSLSEAKRFDTEQEAHVALVNRRPQATVHYCKVVKLKMKPRAPKTCFVIEKPNVGFAYDIQPTGFSYDANVKRSIKFVTRDDAAKIADWRNDHFQPYDRVVVTEIPL